MVYCAMENVANLLYILHLNTNKVLINVLQAYIVMLKLITKVTRLEQYVEQELFILPEHPVFSGVRVRSLVYCVVICR
jgi:hypothetical protein